MNRLIVEEDDPDPDAAPPQRRMNNRGLIHLMTALALPFLCLLLCAGAEATAPAATHGGAGLRAGRYALASAWSTPPTPNARAFATRHRLHATESAAGASAAVGAGPRRWFMSARAAALNIVAKVRDVWRGSERKNVRAPDKATPRPPENIRASARTSPAPETIGVGATGGGEASRARGRRAGGQRHLADTIVRARARNRRQERRERSRQRRKAAPAPPTPDASETPQASWWLVGLLGVLHLAITVASHAYDACVFAALVAARAFDHLFGLRPDPNASAARQARRRYFRIYDVLL